MKQILIILSLFLVTSCDEKESSHHLFKWELASGTKWKEFGVEDDHKQYIGETKNGEPHGLGILYMWEKENVLYQGQWKDGLFHGEGYHNGPGINYDGEWKDGKKHGKGFIYYNAIKWFGEFKEDQFHGQGTVILTKGEFKGQKYFG
jgi:hypothetical protein